MALAGRRRAAERRLRQAGSELLDELALSGRVAVELVTGRDGRPDTRTGASIDSELSLR